MAGENKTKGQTAGNQVELTLTDEQRQEIERVFGPELAKKVESVLIAEAGAGLQSMIVVN